MTVKNYSWVNSDPSVHSWTPAFAAGRFFFKNIFIWKVKIHVSQDDICHLFGRNQEQFSILWVYELHCIYTNNNMKVILKVLCFFQLNLKGKEHIQLFLQVSKQFWSVTKSSYYNNSWMLHTNNNSNNVNSMKTSLNTGWMCYFINSSIFISG